MREWPPREPQGLNSHCQAWGQGPLPEDPSGWSLGSFLSTVPCHMELNFPPSDGHLGF